MTNVESGEIYGLQGVLAQGAVSLVNYGTISGGSNGVDVAAGGSVTNQMSATITGYLGIYASTDAATVVNYGTIAGNNSAAVADGIYLTAGGSVTNQAGGSISGHNDGVAIGGTAGTVDNLGRIQAYVLVASNGGNFGIQLMVGGTVINGVSGGTVSPAYILGYHAGIYSNPLTAGTVTNYGTIYGSGGAGIQLGAGTIVNGPDGATGALISGGYALGIAVAGAGKIVNYGTVQVLIANDFQSAPFYGIRLGGAGSIGNLGPNSTIEGYVGVYAQLNDTVTNAGTIEAPLGLIALIFGGGTNKLIVDPGADFNGTVIGGGTATMTLNVDPATHDGTAVSIGNTSGSSTMELASGTSRGTINGLGSQYIDFASLVFDPGSKWTVKGNDQANGLGTLGISGFTFGDTIDLTGFVATSRSFADNSLVLTNVGGTHATLGIVGSFTAGDFLIAGDGSTGTDIAMELDLGYGQTIVEAGITATSETVTTGVMTLYDNASPVYTINVGTSLSTGDFILTPNGSDTDSSWTPSSGAMAPASRC